MQDARAVRERARDGDPLLHAARELVRVAVGEAREAHEVDPLLRLVLGQRGRQPARHLGPEHDVLPHREPREQRVALEDHAAIGAGPVDGLSVEQHLARRCGSSRPAMMRAERRLAAARRADHAQQLAAVGLEAHAIERQHRPRRRPAANVLTSSRTSRITGRSLSFAKRSATAGACVAVARAARQAARRRSCRRRSLRLGRAIGAGGRGLAPRARPHAARARTSRGPRRLEPREQLPPERRQHEIRAEPDRGR